MAICGFHDINPNRNWVTMEINHAFVKLIAKINKPLKSCVAELVLAVAVSLAKRFMCFFS
jgi:hypothetical protein